MPLTGSPNKPSLATNNSEYTLDLDVGGGPAESALRPRGIPNLQESFVPVTRLAESFWLDWLVPPRDYFDFRVPQAFKSQSAELAVETAPGQWSLGLDGSRSAALTFASLQ